MEIQRQLKSHGAWIGKWTFILAATGSAVGLGNIWGFPYKAGTNGGGAFVLIYLGCILIIGIPIMISEIILGRRAGNSPINAMRSVALASNRSSSWQIIGWSGIFAGVLILSFYSVIAGICLNYVFISASSSVRPLYAPALKKDPIAPVPPKAPNPKPAPGIAAAI